MKLSKAKVAGIAATSVVMLGGPALGADKVADFYKDKEVKIIVSSGAGGGYDAYARLLAGRMGEYIPGKPNIIVQNMPGAGGVRAANWLYNVAPKDGTVFAMVQRTVPFLEIFGKKGPQFVANKFNWIGSANNEVTICSTMKTTGFKTIQDVMEKELIVGGSGPNDTETAPAIMNNIFGTKFKIISGYPSSTAITLAMERGEVQALCSSYGSLRSRNSDWFEKDKINILVQMSTRKHPDLPNVPLALDMAKDPETKAILELNDARLEIGRPFMAPPGVPKERVAALRKAFMATMKDAEFLKKVKSQEREVTPVSGEDVQALIERVSNTDKKLIAKLDELLIYKGTKGKAKVQLESVTGSISEIIKGGRSIVVKGKDGKAFKASVSGSRTKIMVAGKEGKRGDFKVGMTCTVKAPANGEEAANIDCK
ncbi:MAG: hypothetical protein RLZ98_1599 [Pseudomonadota bacterium]|jgi:tripartite-type tricarboxylate transporter receptor subunit TctC